jgi:hypothetical protein
MEASMKRQPSKKALVAGTMIVAGIALARALYPDIKRYWKIRTM